MWENIKDFYYDHQEGCIGAVVIGFFIALILFLGIPVHGTMEVSSLRWNWDIPIEQYQVVHHDSLSHPPSDAYDTYTTLETYYTTRTETYTVYVNGHSQTRTRTVQVPHVRTRYHYKTNEWRHDHYICNSGTDRKPFEKECSIPFDVSNPQLGDVRRRDTKKTYEVLGYDKVREKYATYEVSEGDWERIEEGGTISFKRFRFGDKIWDVTFD